MHHSVVASLAVDSPVLSQTQEARRRRLVKAAAMTKAVLAVDFLRAWWAAADNWPTRMAGVLGVGVIITGSMLMISMVVERRSIGEFPLFTWFLAWAWPVFVAVLVWSETGDVGLVVRVAVASVALASAAMYRPT